jgi:hypothetical protein
MFRTMSRTHLFFILQQGLEISERPVARGWLLLVVRRCLAIGFGHLMSRVFILVTVDTQQLPVAAVRWIVIVVVILMMNRELSNSLA